MRRACAYEAPTRGSVFGGTYEGIYEGEMMMICFGLTSRAGEEVSKVVALLGVSIFLGDTP